MEELQMAPEHCRNNPSEIFIHLCFSEALALDEPLRGSVMAALRPALSDFGELRTALLPAKAGRYSAGLLITPDGLLLGEAGAPGLSLTFGDAPAPPDDAETLQSLAQTWQWDEAEAALSAAPWRVTLRSVNSLDLDIDRRIELVQGALYALTGLLEPAALIFPQSQCCVDPASYLENDPAGDDYFAIYGLVNTRVFTVEEDETRSVFMDTLGLHTLGLPDAQCLINGEETDFAELAYWLYNLAEYMRETPGSFEDGDSIVGLDDEEWEISYSAALIEPERCVVNVNTMQLELEDLGDPDELEFDSDD